MDAEAMTVRRCGNSLCLTQLADSVGVSYKQKNTDICTLNRLSSVQNTRAKLPKNILVILNIVNFVILHNLFTNKMNV
jgi:hypothetical protein